MSILRSRSRRKALLLEGSLGDSPGDSLGPVSSPSLDPWRDFEGGKIELFFAKLFYYVRLRRRQFILGFLALLVSFFSVTGYLSWSSHRESVSLIAFQSLLKEPTMNLESGASEIAVEKLDEYARKHPHAKARLRAMLYQQRYLEKSKKYEEAAKLCLKIASQLETPELRAHFNLRAALHAENIDDYETAEKGYRLAVKAMPQESKIKARVLFGQGRMLAVLGKKAKARKVFQEILSFEKGNSQNFLAPATAYLLELKR